MFASATSGGRLYQKINILIHKRFLIMPRFRVKREPLKRAENFNGDHHHSRGRFYIFSIHHPAFPRELFLNHAVAPAPSAPNF